MVGPQSAQINADDVKPLIVELSRDSYGGRGGGYSGERRAADYIAKQYREIGLQPRGNSTPGKGIFLQRFRFYPHNAERPWQQLSSQNVLGFLPGSDPILSEQVVVIGAHYDGQGRSGEADAGPRNASVSTKGTIWPSANDNLTGSSAVLAVARAIVRSGLHPKRSILFAAFGAEEHEMSGSIFYVNHSTIPLDKQVAMINLECLGKSPNKPLTVDAMMTGGFWAAAIRAANTEAGTSVQPSIPVPIPDSDHYAFSSARIASVVISGPSDSDRHQPSDLAEKVDFGRTAEAANFALALVLNLANREERPKFQQCPMPDLGMTADLATPAECDVLHLEPSQGCLRVTNIVKGRPAEKAGLETGDALLAYYSGADVIPFKRDAKLSELQALMESVLRGKLGRQMRTVVLRKGKRLELVLPVTP